MLRLKQHAFIFYCCLNAHDMAAIAWCAHSCVNRTSKMSSTRSTTMLTRSYRYSYNILITSGVVKYTWSAFSHISSCSKRASKRSCLPLSVHASTTTVTCGASRMSSFECGHACSVQRAKRSRIYPSLIMCSKPLRPRTVPSACLWQWVVVMWGWDLKQGVDGIEALRVFWQLHANVGRANVDWFQSLPKLLHILPSGQHSVY